MLQLFNPVTDKQSEVLLGFVLRWERIINKQDLIEKCWNIRKADYYIKVFIKKHLLITIGKWKYLIREDGNDVFCIVRYFCWEEWYVWWTRIANAYFRYTQLEQKFVIFNSKISWDKMFGNIRIVFIKTTLSWKKIISKQWIYYPTEEQAFIDFMNYPWFIWWDYDLLEQCLIERKVNVSKIESIIKSMKNNSLYIRFLFMLYKCWYHLNKDLKKYKTTRYIPYIVWNKNQKRKIKDFNLLGY